MRHDAPEPPLAAHAGVHGGAAPRAGWRGWPRPRVRGAQPRHGVETPQPWLQWRQTREHTAPPIGLTPLSSYATMLRTIEYMSR
ncbi:MAG: hypothetical protein MI924_34005 [Chloroflexales bacterium]|nr:hypothetical protein [Chloroflexales bacterium]